MTGLYSNGFMPRKPSRQARRALKCNPSERTQRASRGHQPPALMTTSHPKAQSASSSAKRAEATAQAVAARRLSGALPSASLPSSVPMGTVQRPQQGGGYPLHPNAPRQFGLEGGRRPVPRGPSRIGAPGTVGKGITFFAAAKMPRRNDSRNLDQLARHNLRMHQRAKLSNRLA